MTQPAVREYLNAISNKYQEAALKEKTKLLDASVLATGLDRKHLIKRLNSSFSEPLKNQRPGRPKRFDYKKLKPHIMYLWEVTGYLTPVRLKESFKDWLPFYPDCEASLKMQIHSMSTSTLARYLKQYREEDRVKKGLSTTQETKRSNKLKSNVPIATLDSKVKEPGHMQMDTVSHCGMSSSGAFVSSLTLTDILSGWTTNRAFLGKTGKSVIEALFDMEKFHIPFDIRVCNGDSGSEFVNRKVIDYAKDREWKLTRSRPYKKNDNCYVEQKNYTHVRQLFGYERLEEAELVELMNDIYKNYWNPLQNYFAPSVKLKEKIRVGAKIKKKFDIPKTPYQRLMQSPYVSKEAKEQLQIEKQSLNPFELKRGLDKKIQLFYQTLRNTKLTTDKDEYKEAA